MSVQSLTQDARLRRVLTHPDDDELAWRRELDRQLAPDDAALTRETAGEPAIKAVQRLLIFLGYSTASGGGFLVDGDFGRGTNRGIAQFQFEHGVGTPVPRAVLCYPCQWNTARGLITSIPDVRLTSALLAAMLEVARDRCDTGKVVTGDVDDAIFHLNALHKSRFLECPQVAARYGAHARSASDRVAAETGVVVRPEWILAIIRQETAGVIRPRFEQHYLSRLNEAHPGVDLSELRMRSMSLGLGQIMGENYGRVGAPDATTLFTAPAADQVLFVARFLAGQPDAVERSDPGEADFRAVARFYNGPKYEAHHYHEALSKWFREFRGLMA